MNPKTIFERLFFKEINISGGDKISDAVRSFGLTEKVVFYLFFAIFAISSLYMLLRVNNAFMVEVPVGGGTLQEGVIGYPRYINPILIITDSGRDLSALIYSGLLKQTASGELVPDLAESYTISADGLTYDFILKDNIYFQDGAPVTADDIEFTVLKAQDPSLKSPKEGNWEGVAIQKVNAKEIKFILKRPYGPFLQNTTLGILPKHIWGTANDPDSFTLSNFNASPIGSGPYMIKSIKTSGAGLPEYYHLVPFNNYAGGEAYISDLIIRFYNNEQSLLEAYDRNEIQSLNSISPDKIQYIKSRNTEIKTVPLPRVFGVFFNQSQAPILIHKEVREALNEAVDRNLMVEEILNGYGTPIRGPIPLDLLGLDSTSTTETAEERINKARKILTSNGWATSSDGVMQKKSSKTTEVLRFTISTGDAPDLVKAANLAKDAWNKIGADVSVKVFESSDLNQNVIRSRKYDALLFGEIIPPGLDIYGFWHSSERNDPGLNIALYTNTKVDALLEAARATSDSSTAINNYRKLQSIIDNDIPTVFLYSPDFIYAVPKKLGGINLGTIITPADRFLQISDWYLETERVWKIFTNK